MRWFADVFIWIGCQVPSFYPKGIVSRWSEYRLLLTWRTYPPSIWFLISSHISHLINLNTSLRPGVVAQWHTPANPHTHGRLKQENQERGLASATESSDPVWYTWVPASKPNKQGFWKKNSTRLWVEFRKLTGKECLWPQPRFEPSDR